MNTQFNYIYRDASNYKQFGSVIFEGPFTHEQQERLKNALDGGEFFIADQIDIPEIFFDFGEDSTEDDHCWHEFYDMFLTPSEATDERTFEQFVCQVEQESQKGWQEFEQHLGKHLSD